MVFKSLEETINWFAYKGDGKSPVELVNQIATATMPLVEKDLGFAKRWIKIEGQQDEMEIVKLEFKLAARFGTNQI